MDGVIKKPKVKLRFESYFKINKCLKHILHGFITISKSDYIKAAVLWNDLPDDFRQISNFNQFKNILKSWNGNGNVQFVLTFKFV
jgi:hypothetical protein